MFGDDINLITVVVMASTLSVVSTHLDYLGHVPSYVQQMVANIIQVTARMLGLLLSLGFLIMLLCEHL